MGIETTYYGIDWKWFRTELEHTGSMGFFWELLDDEDTEEGHEPWRPYVFLPKDSLWENWRAGECLARELGSLGDRTSKELELRIQRFLVRMAAIPDLAKNCYAPAADLGAPAEIDTEYLGALSPDSVSSLAKEARAALHQVASVWHSSFAPPDSYLCQLPAIMTGYCAFLEETESRRWAILITAS